MSDLPYEFPEIIQSGDFNNGIDTHVKRSQGPAVSIPNKTENCGEIISENDFIMHPLSAIFESSRTLTTLTESEPATVNQPCSLEDLLVLTSVLIGGQRRGILISAPLIDLKQALGDVLAGGKGDQGQAC